MKNELDVIYKTFADYIRGHDYFDIVYSEKIGYIRFLIRDPIDFAPDVLDTPEKMLTALFNDIINDVVFSPDNPNQNHEHLTLTAYEEMESRRRIMAILETIEGGDKARYIDLMDAYIKEYQENSAREGGHDDE